MKVKKSKYNVDIQRDVLNKVNNYYKILGIDNRKEKSIKFHLKYKEEAEKLFKKYKFVNLITIEFHAFGETLPRLYTLLQDIKEKNNSGLYVVLPYFYSGFKGDIPNKRMFDLFEEDMTFIKESNLEFWKYIFLFYFSKINIDNYFSYLVRSAMIPYTQMGKPLIEFSDVVEKEAKEKFKELSIHEPFVGLHVRDSGCTKFFSNKIESGLRESDIYSLKKSCEEMLKLGIRPIRMGKFETRKLNISGVIDYAGQYHDDLLDFYLISKCKFMLGTNSGLSCMVPFFGRPLLRVNAFGDNLIFESVAITDYDMYIPKKLWSDKEKRYLNLRESLDMHDFCLLNTTNYHVNGIKVRDNTEEEIWEAVQEMNYRIDGTWIVTKEEKECYKKYNEIVEKWINKRKSINMRRLMRAKGFTLPAIPICYSYLKKNIYLLEEI